MSKAEELFKEHLDDLIWNMIITNDQDQVSKLSSEIKRLMSSDPDMSLSESEIV